MTNINQFCTAWRTGLRRVWKIPNTAHSDLVHMMSDELPIFDEICRPSLLFIHKCFFHSSNLVKFVARYGVMSGWYKSFIFVYLASNLTSGPFLMDVLMLIMYLDSIVFSLRDELRFDISK